MNCPYSGKCGGCDYIKFEYPEQLKKKQNYVNSMLGSIASKAGIHIDKIIGSKEPLYYRNKVHAVFDRDRYGHIVRGIYKEGSHEVVPVKGCLLENRQADAIINTVTTMLPSFKLKTYDEDTGYGLMRHILVRVGHYHDAEGILKDDIMVVIVTSSSEFPSKNNFVKALRKAHPEITTIVRNINSKRTSMILGDRNEIIYGRGYIEDELMGLRFRISPSAFYQINPYQTELLYRQAINLAGLTGRETVIDAYCGTGTIGMAMAGKARSVIGIELNPDAVKDAVSNAARNNIKNIKFINADATEYLTGLASKTDTAISGNETVLVMDPPRSGSTREFIRAAAALDISRIVYVSCNPETLATDLKEFAKLKYNPERIVPVDMFPATKHVESVVLLERM